MGLLIKTRYRKLKNVLIHRYIKHYNVDMSLAVEQNPEAYPDFNSFFIRPLRPELRPIVQDSGAIACPVDGCISQLGRLGHDSVLQAKGRNFSLTALLGGSEQHAQLFRNGHFATLYLAPRDYHRVHMPLTGKLREMIYVPGHLFSVNSMTAQHVDQLFARNERVICLFDTVAGPMAVILVAAFFVAGMNTVWAGDITPCKKSRKIWTKFYQNNEIVLNRGEEMGHFKLGSTVIVLFGPDQIQWVDELSLNQTVKMGQLLGLID